MEGAALGQAERECLADAEERAAMRRLDAARRIEADRKLVAEMTKRIGIYFPSCPPRESASIAQHTASRGSGRVGRTAAGRNLEEAALTAAVIAAIRHKHTSYDQLLSQGMERADARRAVADRVDQVLAMWRKADPHV